MSSTPDPTAYMLESDCPKHEAHAFRRCGRQKVARRRKFVLIAHLAAKIPNAIKDLSQQTMLSRVVRATRGPRRLSRALRSHQR